MPRPITDQLDWFANETVTIDNTAGGITLTAGTHSVSGRPNAQVALLTLEAGQIRFTLDGTAPTTTAGHIMDIGDVVTLKSSNEVRRWKGIRTGATSGTLIASYAR